MTAKAAQSASSRRRRALARFALTTVLGLGSAELLARHYLSGPLDLVRPSTNRGLLFELRPGHYVSDGYFLRSPVVEYTVDARGCRTLEAARSRPGSSLLFLGSSIAFGIGVGASDALPEQAYRVLAERSPELTVSPSNCGVPGYNLLQTLEQAVLAIERDAARRVVIVVGPKHGSVSYDWSRIVPPSPAMRWLTSHVRLARLVHLVRLIHESNGFRLPPAAPAALRAALDRFADAAARTGTRAVIFEIGRLEHPSLDLRSELSKRGLAHVAVAPPPHDSRYVHPDGDHWNPRGVRFLVEQMGPALAALATPVQGDAGSMR